ncbi:hypothetical protein Patl1_11762 [Pistacia atlantica]|uniref:Uncharacterized protein n=1 Tax=Pistacia atlantica TaxID=434234 RepID=A0ACC1A9X8_9ROSI|nr:hypothetical protein Patl1_11762 [Pistacia atlantica]
MANSYKWRSKAILAELKELPHLNSLYIHIPNAMIMPRNLFDPEKLERYKILIGEKWGWYGKYTTSRTLKLNNSHSFRSYEFDIWFEKVEDLYLDQLGGVEDVVEALNSEKGFPELKHLCVQNSWGDLLHIFNSETAHCHTAFPVLESLYLHKLKKLKKICEGRLYAESFTNLRTIIIRQCDELEHVFSISMARNLSHLQEVEVTDCKNLKEIFGDEEIEESTDHADQKVHCPSLEKLILSHLDNIQLIWHNKLQADSFCKLKVSRVEFCGKLISFVPPDRLGRLSKNPQRLHRFQNLEIVRVTECWSMKNLFPVSIALGLRQLKELEINSCGLEEIVANEEVKVAAVFKFLKLDFLQLVDLPELKSFYPRSHTTELPLLKSLVVYHCHKLLSFQNTHVQSQSENQTQHPLFSPGEVISDLKLEKLSINRDDIKLICSGCSHFSGKTFHKLEDLQVVCFHDESPVFPLDFLRRFHKLRTLVVARNEKDQTFRMPRVLMKI